MIILTISEFDDLIAIIAENVNASVRGELGASNIKLLFFYYGNYRKQEAQFSFLKFTTGPNFTSSVIEHQLCFTRSS